ncbi:MAG: hypothetical protein ACAF42_12160 [Limnothrix sp. BL-A-16]
MATPFDNAVAIGWRWLGEWVNQQLRMQGECRANDPRTAQKDHSFSTLKGLGAVDGPARSRPWADRLFAFKFYFSPAYDRSQH